jgi:hypothetical protein
MDECACRVRGDIDGEKSAINEDDRSVMRVLKWISLLAWSVVAALEDGERDRFGGMFPKYKNRYAVMIVCLEKSQRTAISVF